MKSLVLIAIALFVLSGCASVIVTDCKLVGEGYMGKRFYECDKY